MLSPDPKGPYPTLCTNPECKGYHVELTLTEHGAASMAARPGARATGCVTEDGEPWFCTTGRGYQFVRWYDMPERSMNGIKQSHGDYPPVYFIRDNYPVPKFASVEEAEAWLENFARGRAAL